jgi:hypothetical protein
MMGLEKREKTPTHASFACKMQSLEEINISFRGKMELAQEPSFYQSIPCNILVVKNGTIFMNIGSFNTSK